MNLQHQDLSNTVIRMAQRQCPCKLEYLPPICEDVSDAEAYISEFIKSNKQIDYYCVRCDEKSDYIAHHIVMGYIASADTTLTINYGIFKDEDIYKLKKGEFIWAFKKVSIFPTIAAAYTPAIARGENVYEIRCLLGRTEQEAVAVAHHFLTHEWTMRCGLLSYRNSGA